MKFDFHSKSFVVKLNTMTTKIFTGIALLTGVGLIFIGLRFIIAPEVAESGFGIRFNNAADFSFHFIKGIRDIFSGFLISLFLIMRERRALAITLLAGIMIPIMDLIVVLKDPINGLVSATPHLMAIVICGATGFYFLFNRKDYTIESTATQSEASILTSASNHQNSLIKFNILPGEKTPWHFHTLFSETFHVIDGSLTVGKNNTTTTLVAGDQITIEAGCKHFFKNNSKEICNLQVTISPGNLQFEQALLISKGLAKDGLVSAAGTPKRLEDLALFIYLNNSRMVGLQKIAEPLFNQLAKAAIRNGRLQTLITSYCSLEPKLSIADTI